MNHEKNISNTVFILFIGAVSSTLFKFITQPLIAYKFGASSATDAYIVATTIPMIIGSFVVGGILLFVLIPTLIKLRVEKGEIESQKVASTVLNVLLLILFLFSIIYFIFAKPIMHLLAPGLSDNAKYQATIMSRILVPNIILFCFISFYTGLFNSYKYFTLAAFAPLFYSIVFIVAIIFLSKKIGIASLAIGSLLGAVLQTIILTRGLHKINFKLSASLLLNHPSVKGIFLLSIPVLLLVVFSNIGVIVFRFIASRLQTGGIATLNFSDQIMTFTNIIFVAPICVGIFPYFSQHAAENEMGKFNSLFISSAKFLLAITMPIAFLLWIFSYPIIAIIFQRGAFDIKATQLTALNLKYYSLGFVGVSVSMLLTQAYFSLRRMATVCKIGLLSLILNVLLAIVLSKFLNIGGIALTASITVTIATSMMLYLFNKELKLALRIKNVAIFFLKIATASLAMGIVAKKIFLALEGNNSFLIGKPRMLSFILSVISGVAVFLGISILVKLKEINKIKELIKSSLFNIENWIKSLQ